MRALVLALGLAPGPATAAVLVVDPADPGSYATIQAAIDAAADGDEVRVAAGTYVEALDFSGKPLRVVGDAGSAGVVLDGGGAAWAVTAAAGEPAGTTLEGVTVHNPGAGGIRVSGAHLALVDVVVEDLGTADHLGAGLVATGATVSVSGARFSGLVAAVGAGIYVSDSTLGLTDTELSGNTADHGAAVFATRSEVALTAVSVLDNTGALGASIYAFDRVTLTAEQLVATGNTSVDAHGAALYAGVSCEVTLLDSTITDNTWVGTGRGADVTIGIETGSSLTATGTTFARNQGAIAIHDDSRATFDACTVADNTNLVDGALWAYDGADLLVTDSTFIGNQNGESGGAIRADGPFSLRVEASSFEFNTAGRHGGAIYADGAGTVDLVDTTFLGNQAGLDGGAARLADLGSTATVWGGTFQTNSAGGNGGGLFLGPDTGGEITASTFEGNEARAGGGGLECHSSGTPLTVSESTFSENSAGWSGGGLDVGHEPRLIVLANTFSANEASQGGGGLAIGHIVEPVQISLNTFEANLAPYGGGLAAWADALELAGNTFAGNVADNGGGGLSAYGARFHSEGDTFEGNVAGTSGGGLDLATNQCTITDLRAVANVAATGGGIHLRNGSLTLLRSALVSNEARDGDGGGLYSDSPVPLLVNRTQFCANRATRGGAAYVGRSLGETWTNNVIQDNVASVGGGLALRDCPVLTIANNTIVGNMAARNSGGGLYLERSAGWFVNNLVAYTVRGDGIEVAQGLHPAMTYAYSAWYDNGGGTATGELDREALEREGSHLFVDPALYEYAHDCSGDLLFPEGTSPLVDAGDPTLTDPDGTRSDIGAWGGPAAEPLADADGDGFVAPIDCDDDDADIHRGVPDVLDDGIDQDCNGLDLTLATADKDHDGHLLDTLIGGDDCNDTDPTIHPGAVDIPADGVDQDCARGDLRAPAGSCSTSGPAAGALSTLLLVAGLVRRRA